MTTSGVTDWPLTASEVIKQALVELGALNSGEEPESTEQDDAMIRLNAMLKSWGGEANLFREGTGTLIVAAGTGAGTLPDDVRDINSVRYVVSATYNRPLTQWNRAQYYAMPNRDQTGNPIAYYVSKTIAGTEIRLWPVPVDEVTLHLDYGRAVETVTSPDETLDIPQEWQEVAILGLAKRCANMFGTTRLDPGTVQRIERDADMLYNRLLDRDRPESYYFEPWDGCYS